MTQDKDAESSRPRVVSWFLRPQAPPLWLGIVVAAGLIALETLLVLALERFTDENAYGALFLLGVLVISANWGFGLAVAITVVSAAVYTYFHMGPDGFNPVKTQDWVAIVIFVPIALLANVLVGQARLRAAEADHRRREAEASKEELRVAAEQLAASRARIVTAADDARRRLERDLHDGAQQRLLALGLELRTVESSFTEQHVIVGDHHAYRSRHRTSSPQCRTGCEHAARTAIFLHRARHSSTAQGTFSFHRADESLERVVQPGHDRTLADLFVRSDVGDGLAEIVGTDHNAPVFDGQRTQRVDRVQRSRIGISHKIMLRACPLCSLWSAL